MDAVGNTLEARKSRGAFFTPVELADFMAAWAIRSGDDNVLEPSCGDAVFLLQASRRLKTLVPDPQRSQLVGYDIHVDSLTDAGAILAADGAAAELHHSDFFEVNSDRKFTAVLGNPPFIRFQGFNGRSRELAIEHARRVGVELSGLASSWAGFVVRSADMLTVGGRLALVLPSELLSVNYAAPVRRFLMKSFASIEIVVFDELVFAGVQTDAVVLLADGFRTASTEHFTLHTARDPQNASTDAGLAWRPIDPAGKWTDALNGPLASPRVHESFDPMVVPLATWGRVSSGTVTGANDFFAMSNSRAAEIGLTSDELRRILPRGLPLASLVDLTTATWSPEGDRHDSVLFAPGAIPSDAARSYIQLGEQLGLHLRYKTRIRGKWWQVPLSPLPTASCPT